MKNKFILSLVLLLIINMYYSNSAECRYYSPNVGRFLERDPIGVDNGMNVFSYMENIENTHSVVKVPFNNQFINSNVNNVGEPLTNIDLLIDTNSYHYAYNNPINLTDPYGLNPWIRASIVGSKKALDWVKKNIKLEGLGAPGTRDEGRICQIRYKSQPVIRLDYARMRGSGGEKRLHLNVGPGRDNLHISIDPRSLIDWFQN